MSKKPRLKEYPVLMSCPVLVGDVELSVKLVICKTYEATKEVDVQLIRFKKDKAVSYTDPRRIPYHLVPDIKKVGDAVEEQLAKMEEMRFMKETLKDNVPMIITPEAGNRAPAHKEKIGHLELELGKMALGVELAFKQVMHCVSSCSAVPVELLTLGDSAQ